MPDMSRIPFGECCNGRSDGDGEPYIDQALIGTGAYGMVYRARDRRNGGALVALKRIRVQVCEDGVPTGTVREIALLRKLERLEHPNLVRLIDVCCNGQFSDREMMLTLVFEYVDQDLSAFISQCPPPGLPQHVVKDLMRQMFLGLDCLHSHKIVHRDLKPQNILVTRNRQLKIADFGLARVYSFSMTLTSVVVTLWYRAPEVLLQARYASPVDLWSCGCIFVEMCTRRPLFTGQSDIDMLHKIFSTIGLPDASDWPDDISLPRSAFAFTPRLPFDELIPEIDSAGKDMLEKLLHFNPHVRLTATEALQHPYFADMEGIPEGIVGSVRAAASSPDGAVAAAASAPDGACSATDVLPSGHRTPASK